MPPGEIACEPPLQPSPSTLGPRGILDESVLHGPIILVLPGTPLHIRGMCNPWQSFAGVLGSLVLKERVYAFLRRQCGVLPVLCGEGLKCFLELVSEDRSLAVREGQG